MCVYVYIYTYVNIYITRELCWVYVTNVYTKTIYGVASVSRLLKITGLFCKRALYDILQKRPMI